MVLILEDADFIRLELKRKLEESGYEVLDSATLEDAYRKLSSLRDKIKVVIIDIKVPTTSGSKFVDGLEMFKSLDPDLRRHYNAIILSGNINSGQLIKKGSQIGINDFIAKPYSYGRVLESIEGVAK